EDAIDRRVFDYTFQIDYGKLHHFICGDKHEIGCAKLWGSPPPKDTFWEMVRRKGWEVRTFERSYGKEKKVDVAIAYQMAKDAVHLDKENSDITLVAGDKDFVPVVEDLVADGFNVTVAFWDHAAREMREAASTFFSLNQWMDHLTF
ncbi:MAG: NYN domain-containing protein, partial [Pirellulales bacterium]|nr:NYN domain-containing protein [Pirellulales bacterium]